MAEAVKYTKTVHNTKVSGKMTKHITKDVSSIPMETFTKATGKMTKPTGKVNTDI
jgi:hypothetical protein